MKVEIAIGQIKPRKGDYAANLARVGELFAQLEAEEPETRLLVLPETVLSGYFLEGGVLDVARTQEELLADLLGAYQANVRRKGASMDVAIGFYERHEGRIYNSACYATLSTLGGPPGKVLHVHRKFFLPTYGVFDEERFVARGHQARAFETAFGRVGILICEDVWHSVLPTLIALQGAELLLVLSASPGRDFTGAHIGNVSRWNLLLPGVAAEHNVWVVYAGLVGFEGGKGFTGSSQVIDPFGDAVVIGSDLEECLVRAAIDLEDVTTARVAMPLLADLEDALGDVVREMNRVAARPDGGAPA